jgi:hypothetical protein
VDEPIGMANAVGAVTPVHGVLLPQKTPLYWGGAKLTFSYMTSQGHLIEDIRADMNTSVGTAVQGRGNIIRNNQVVSTGGSTQSDNANGISTIGPGARVLNNDVIETKGDSVGFALGIAVFHGSGSVVENNRIGNSSFGPDSSYGININQSSDVLVSNNRVTTMNYGVYYDTGGNPASTGKYRDNLTSGVTTPFTGGTNAGGNN